MKKLMLVALLAAVLLGACAPATPESPIVTDGDGSQDNGMLFLAGEVRSVNRVAYDSSWFAVRFYTMNSISDIKENSLVVVMTNDPRVIALQVGDSVIFSCSKDTRTLRCDLDDNIIIESVLK